MLDTSISLLSRSSLTPRQSKELAEKKHVNRCTKQRILRELDGGQVSVLPNTRWFFAVAIVAVLFAMGLFFLWPAKEIKTETPKVFGSWLVADAHSESMTFADQSEIVLAAGSSARVMESGPGKVELLLEKGKADVRVTHGSRTNWVSAAGPYSVRVTGTQFTLSWATDRKQFSLDLKKGTVVVTGPCCARALLSTEDNA